jgi:hypothetical protein
MSISFFVPGKPATAGSKTAVRMGSKLGVIEAGSNQSRARKRSWRGDLRDAAQTAVDARDGWGDATIAMHLVLVIVRPRPSTHLRSGRNAGTVKDWAVTLAPVQRPDATKILRAAEDAMQGILWADDSQITRQVIYKVYGDQAGMTARTEGLYVWVTPAIRYYGPRLGLLHSCAEVAA